jgi:hypothetical protein
LVQVDAADCPNPTEVAAAFATLFSQTELRFVRTPAAAQVVFVDLGARYRVEVAGHARTIEDPDRRCPERARTAVVFAFLTLEPPVMQVPPSQVPPSHVPSQPPQQQPSRARHAPAPTTASLSAAASSVWRSARATSPASWRSTGFRRCK